MQNNLQNKALNRCYFFLKFRPRTEKEIVNFLYKKAKKYKLNKKRIDDVINELKVRKYIDDKKFVEWFVLKSIDKKIKAPFIIKKELITHGVKTKDIDEYFENNTIDENAQAIKLLNKYWLRWLNIEAQERFNKALNMLLRKGFRFEIAKKAIEEFKQKY
jgi:SOS response regulatory protein OraA/RecX